MSDEPTCGKGLAEHSALPETFGRLSAAVAELLEVHMKALDLTDHNSMREHNAYSELVKDHRKIAADLTATAKRMAGYRDLPMGKHDEQAMANPEALDAFRKFVKLENELVALLQHRLKEDQEMLHEMGLE